MTDNLPPEKRSWNMSRVHSKDTSVEVKVRKYLFSKGFRYRKNVSALPGKPDIVLPKYRAVIFIHGCFWHRHQNCKRATTPKTHLDYWLPKFQRNIENDAKNYEELKQIGWKPIIVWGCEINKDFENTMQKLVETITCQNMF